MVSEVFAGISALKAAFDVTKTLKDIDDANRRNAAVIDLQEQILAAQAAQSALIEERSKLLEKLARFEAWEAEKRRYKLTDYGGGTFAYALKLEEANGEPDHRICPHCYEDGHKSILQFSSKSGGRDVFDCPRCKTQYEFGLHVPISRRQDHGPKWR